MAPGGLSQGGFLEEAQGRSTGKEDPSCIYRIPAGRKSQPAPPHSQAPTRGAEAGVPQGGPRAQGRETPDTGFQKCLRSTIQPHLDNRGEPTVWEPTTGPPSREALGSAELWSQKLALNSPGTCTLSFWSPLWGLLGNTGEAARRHFFTPPLPKVCGLAWRPLASPQPGDRALNPGFLA